MNLYCVKKINGQYSVCPFQDRFFENRNIRLSDYCFSAIKLLILRKVSLNKENMDLRVQGEKLINSITEMLDNLFRYEHSGICDISSNERLCVEITNFLNSGNN